MWLCKNLKELIHNWRVFPAGTEGYEKAEVTAGGVDTDELSSKTMECRNVPGLFFIGEVVDVDRPPGGFNFPVGVGRPARRLVARFKPSWVSQEPTKPFAESNYKNKERFMDEKIAAYIKKIESKLAGKKPNEGTVGDRQRISATYEGRYARETEKSVRCRTSGR